MALTTLDARTALVLIDLQNGIVAGEATPYSSAEVVTRAKELAEAFRNGGLPVVLVNVSFGKDFATVVPGRTEAGPAAELPPAGWDAVIDELDAQQCDVRVTKHNWGAFHGTDLDVNLRRRGITQI